MDEEKLVDAPELERTEELRTEEKENETLEEETRLGQFEEEPALVMEETRDVSQELRGKVLGAMREILEDRQVSVGQLGLPAHETKALESLQMAISGKSSDLATYTYADDRRGALEQALAVLQPALARGNEFATGALHLELEDLVERIGKIREGLKSLEDAQDELLEADQKRSLEAAAAAAGGETDEKPEAKPKKKKPAAAKKEPAPGETTLLGGDAAPEVGAAATALTGKELPPEPEQPSTLEGGKAAPDVGNAPTTLVGKELPPEPEQPTTLEGGKAAPEIGGEPTTLGDAAEIEKAAKVPWWRRPFQ